MSIHVPGIDLGTSNSCIAGFDGKYPYVIEVNGKRITPSVVTAFDVNGELKKYVGERAVMEGRAHRSTSYKQFKRRLGVDWNPEEDNGDQTVEGPDGKVWLKGPYYDPANTDPEHIAQTCYSPVELSSYIVKALMDGAADRLGQEISEAVIAVPAGYGTEEKNLVELAGQLAGLSKVHIIDEPTAAALAYGYDFRKTRRVAVFDLGGGTFDISIIQTGNGLVKVLGKNGNKKLGGTDFDRELVNYVAMLWSEQYGDEDVELADIRASDTAMKLVYEEAEAVKIRLSSDEETTFKVDDLSKRTGENTDAHAHYPVTRDTFELLTESLREKTRVACLRAVEDAQDKDPNFSVKDIHDVILVGGMTRVPAIRATVAQFFGMEPKRDISPEEAVALGAAVKGAQIAGIKTNLSVEDITSHPICLETVNDGGAGGIAAILVEKGTPYPIERSWPITTARDGQSALNLRFTEGASPRSIENELLYSQRIDIEPMPAGCVNAHAHLSIHSDGRVEIECGGVTYAEAT